MTSWVIGGVLSELARELKLRLKLKWKVEELVSPALGVLAADPKKLGLREAPIGAWKQHDLLERERAREMVAPAIARLIVLLFSSENG